MTTPTDTPFTATRPTPHPANGRSRRFVLAQITAPRATTERERLRSTSRSSSTGQGRCPARRSPSPSGAVDEAIGYLASRDRFSVVAFDDVVDVVVESTPASAEARRRRLERMRADRRPRQHQPLGGLVPRREQVAAHLATEASTAAC